AQRCEKCGDRRTPAQDAGAHLAPSASLQAMKLGLRRAEGLRRVRTRDNYGARFSVSWRSQRIFGVSFWHPMEIAPSRPQEITYRGSFWKPRCTSRSSWPSILSTERVKFKMMRQ